MNCKSFIFSGLADRFPFDCSFEQRHGKKDELVIPEALYCQNTKINTVQLDQGTRVFARGLVCSTCMGKGLTVQTLECVIGYVIIRYLLFHYPPVPQYIVMPYLCGIFFVFSHQNMTKYMR